MDDERVSLVACFVDCSNCDGRLRRPGLVVGVVSSKLPYIAASACAISSEGTCSSDRGFLLLEAMLEIRLEME